MYLAFSKNKIGPFQNERSFKGYHLDYFLEEKEVYFENSRLILFLKTNYSENYINTQLSNLENVSQESVRNAFSKDGLWVIIDKESEQITIKRDVSGLCSCYYFSDNEEFHVATNVHVLAKNKANKLSKIAVHQLLYFDYLWDGQTIYNDIYQLKVGGEIDLSPQLEILSINIIQPIISVQENDLSEKENIIALRKEIVNAHKNYLNLKNVVFLSGGIDSVAMLIALDDITNKDTIENHSFKVKGTTQDETEYAQSIADHLNIDLYIIERDISNEISFNTFKNEVLKMNNPYSGIWIFGNQIDNTNQTTYFAGQDTRLHTPSLNKLDAIAFNIFSLSKYFKLIFFFLDKLLFPFKILFNTILKEKVITNKYFLGLRRALYLFNTKKYVELVYFKADKASLSSLKLPIEEYNNIAKAYRFSLKGIKSKRALYNAIVSKKWIEQYVNDIRYMVDMVNSQGGKLAMPFYDMDLAIFSATIPFDLSVKNMKGKAQFGDRSSIIHKYVLREALVDKIDKKTYLRSKAVSRTGHLIFNQGLSQVLKSIINEDLLGPNSFIKEFKLDAFLERFLLNKNDWKMMDDKYLLKVYYTACLIVYQNEIG